MSGVLPRPEEDPAWQQFCAETAPLGSVPARPSRKLAEIGITARIVLAPAHRNLPSQEAEFSDLMAEWEQHGGRFAEAPSQAPSMPSAATPIPVSAETLSASLPKLRRALSSTHRPEKIPVSPTIDQWHNLDSASARRIQRGQMPIDAVLDLHGQNLQEAFQSLSGMVRLARLRQYRLLLVITGKGRRTTTQDGMHHPFDGDGKIRRALPSWLADAAIAPHLVGVGTAHRAHGGSGAFYLLLRRRTEGLEGLR